MTFRSLTPFFRIIKRNKEIYLLKVLSLGIAFATSSLVILFSLNEFYYDRFHEGSTSIFRVLKRSTAENHLGNRLSAKIPREIFRALSSGSGDSLKV
jgi:putative ABC transport system permease protein